jgi:hypothetical protein
VPVGVGVPVPVGVVGVSVTGDVGVRVGGNHCVGVGPNGVGESRLVGLAKGVVGAGDSPGARVSVIVSVGSRVASASPRKRGASSSAVMPRQ